MGQRISRTMLALAVAAGVCSAVVRHADAQSLKKMTLVQMHPNIGIGEEIFLYAVPKRLGFFKAEGLDVDIQNSQTGMISAQVLQSSNAQVGTTAAAAVMTVREQNGDLISFFNLKRNAGTFLVVLKDSPINKLEDLKGKNVGAPSFGAGGGLGLKQNLSAIGITPEQYTAIATGAGPSAIAALKSGKIDALVMWDAMLGAAENTGLDLRTVKIPLEDGQVGTTLATTASFAKANPKEVAGYCRAMTKGLLFTATNPAAAIKIFWEEFPTSKPTSLDDATALKNSVHIMNRFLEKALQDQPKDAPLGKFIVENWKNTHEAFVKLGTLKGAERPEASFTEQFITACNDFDHAAIVAQAKAMN
ncbi:ABC transporter substrate-binding protein [Rhodoplanes sp. Z2-YC6860]|uniref:ABC transporter substrate-binding protein n=1 Tax=Rhodoplanes sp. Z2-YC6860 TaxID=674703 RepID=UPI00078E14B9|nr:ABC transporter substrate-binding protein [Rhodoplanes sp. Z2-YC6860]AMN40544.1 extracellular solute-binding protein, family 1 [Rhodoplanes sp. Z2-YC6860]